MTPVSKYSRSVALIIAAVVAIVTVANLASAVQTVAVANAIRVSYNLLPGQNSAAIAPPQGVPVHVMGVNTRDGNPGVVSATVLVPAVAPQFIAWYAIESKGRSDAAGSHIVFLDFHDSVDLQVNSVTTMRVHNSASLQQTGNVTMIW